MTTTIKVLKSTDQGAPILGNAWGDLTAMLDACLVNGYNLKTIDSLSFTPGAVGQAGTATATLSTGHLYQPGAVLLVSGADQAAYNGEHILSATTATTVSFPILVTAPALPPASPATSATTITCKTAPLGFDIAFTGTSKRAYRSPNPQSQRHYLRVDNSKDPLWNTAWAKYGKVTVMEGMSDIDTCVGAQAPFDANMPQKNHIGTPDGNDGWFKWYYRNAYNESGASNWVLIGDDRSFYFMTTIQISDPQPLRTSYFFGDYTSFKQGDAYATLLVASDFYQAGNNFSASYQGGSLALGGQNDIGKNLLRDFTQMGGPIGARINGFCPVNSNPVFGLSAQVPWPNGPDYALILHPAYISQADQHIRGIMPGLFPLCQVPTYPDLTVLENVSGYPGRKFLLVAISGNGSPCLMPFDITGPWR